MKWRDLRKSRNIEDRRGQRSNMPSLGRGSSNRGGGGSGLLWMLLMSGGKSKWLIIGVLALTFVFGGRSNLLDLGFNTDTSAPIEQTTTNNQATQATDEEYDFLSAVLASTEDFWAEEFATYDLTYRYPTLVVYSDSVQTQGCGFGSSQVGPFYCPGDEKLYIDLTFYRDLTTQYDAPGDFAMAYVVAHEVGHHVQNVLGTMGDYHNARGRLSETESNELNVRLELQADYYAGAWARYAQEEGLLEVGDIDEALQAAHAVGDDTLQREAYGHVMPDSFTHGTSQQRQEWFTRGYENGTLEGADTFNGKID